MLIVFHLAFFAVFFLTRFFLFIVYAAQFRELSFGKVCLAFFRGGLFDGSILLTFAGIPFLCLLLPFGWAAHIWWRRIWGWCLFGILVAFALILGGDAVYFGYVGRHTGPEILAVQNDLDLLAGYIFGEYLWLVVVVLAALAGAGYGWRRLIRLGVDEKRTPKNAVLGWVILMLYIPTAFLVIRGGVSKKPINIVNAFEGTSIPGGYLTLNGPFALYHSLRHTSRTMVDFFPKEEAVHVVQTWLQSDHETFLDEQYPLLRKRTPQNQGKYPNIVIFMLESWDADFMDCMRRATGQEASYGVTPVFDALSSQGVLFTNFFANGQRSMEGLAAIFAGMPTMPGMPYLGTGMEQNQLAYLGQIAKQHDYETYFLQGAKRNSYRCDAISYLSGFDHYAGSEDIPPVGHEQPKDRWGAWDHDTLQEANRLFAASKKPFLGFVFTLTTHGPHDVPGAEWEKYPTDQRKGRFLNTLSYTDWAIGEFFKRAKQDGYFENTIFILLADHVSGLSEGSADILSRFHVPCLILAPGLAPKVQRDIASQMDLLPTIMDMAGWSGNHASMGRSLFDETLKENRAALCVQGQVVTWIGHDGWMSHDLNNQLAYKAYNDKADAALMEKRLLAFSQLAIHLLSENKVYIESIK